MDAASDFSTKMENLPKFALKQYSTHVAMIVIFVHNYVLDKNLECTCEDDELSCGLYMALPFFILFALRLWTDKTFKRIWKYTCGCCCRCKFFWVLVYHILKAACVGLLWVLFLLIDGDWYVCCYNTYKEHPDLGCKEKLNITEKERVLIAKLKNESMVSNSYS
uniref:Uncharacterized protein n=1 Tax=Amphilophus citrinellus TaxID=61819 RepID=A0A3Q0SL76_AMPCI